MSMSAKKDLSDLLFGSNIIRKDIPKTEVKSKTQEKGIGGISSLNDKIKLQLSKVNDFNNNKNNSIPYSKPIISSKTNEKINKGNGFRGSNIHNKQKEIESLPTLKYNKEEEELLEKLKTEDIYSNSIKLINDNKVLYQKIKDKEKKYMDELIKIKQRQKQVKEDDESKVNEVRNKLLGKNEEIKGEGGLEREILNREKGKKIDKLNEILIQNSSDYIGKKRENLGKVNSKSDPTTKNQRMMGDSENIFNKKSKETPKILSGKSKTLIERKYNEIFKKKNDCNNLDLSGDSGGNINILSFKNQEDVEEERQRLKQTLKLHSIMKSINTEENGKVIENKLKEIKLDKGIKISNMNNRNTTTTTSSKQFNPNTYKIKSNHANIKETKTVNPNPNERIRGNSYSNLKQTIKSNNNNTNEKKDKKEKDSIEKDKLINELQSKLKNMEKKLQSTSNIKPKKPRIFDEDSYEEDDFIVKDKKGGVKGNGSNGIKGKKERLFGRYDDYDDDDDCMEVGFDEIEKEEAITAKIGAEEDYKEYLKEQQMMKKKKI